MKPSEKIKEIYNKMMILDGKKPVAIDLFVGLAIIKYLDEQYEAEKIAREQLKKDLIQ